MFLSFARAIKFALLQFRRNWWLSIATITLLILPLLSVNVIVGIGALAENVTMGIQDKIDVSVYFKSDVQNEQARKVREDILNLSGVKSVDMTTREGALARFKERHANDPMILESLNELGENPFGAALAVKAANIDDYPKIMEFLESPDYTNLVEEKNFDDHRLTISRVEGIVKNVRVFGLTVAGIFGIIAVLIVLTSIRVAIYTHRDEIGIMRLVGAGSWFVRGQFLIEAVFFSLMAMAITLLILYPGLNFIQPYLNNLFEGSNVSLTDYFNSHFLSIFGVQLLFITILALGSTFFALSRYLRK